MNFKFRTQGHAVLQEAQLQLKDLRQQDRNTDRLVSTTVLGKAPALFNMPCFLHTAPHLEQLVLVLCRLSGLAGFCIAAGPPKPTLVCGCRNRLCTAQV